MYSPSYISYFDLQSARIKFVFLYTCTLAERLNIAEEYIGCCDVVFLHVCNKSFRSFYFSCVFRNGVSIEVRHLKNEIFMCEGFLKFYLSVRS